VLGLRPLDESKWLEFEEKLINNSSSIAGILIHLPVPHILEKQERPASMIHIPHLNRKKKKRGFTFKIIFCSNLQDKGCY
jgi:hypothetical protein